MDNPHRKFLFERNITLLVCNLDKNAKNREKRKQTYLRRKASTYIKV